MSAHRIIEPINVLANGFDRVISSLEYRAPDQFRLDRLEDGLDHGIIITLTILLLLLKTFWQKPSSPKMPKINGVETAHTRKPRDWLDDEKARLVTASLQPDF